jgi:hypothetical protein
MKSNWLTLYAKYEPGFESLAVAIVEQATRDLRTLQQSGFVVNGDVITDWPREIVVRRKHGKLYNEERNKRTSGYRTPQEARELVAFFRENLKGLLENLNSPIPHEAALKRLNLTQ